MSIELLYTSAAKGLRQGSRGFCTVLSTAGMPLNLATRLEALSGYRHVYPIDSPHYAANPVAYSHCRVTMAGRPLSILSRVAAYQADYSGRTNKLAHHLVVDAHELPAAGPAWLLQQPGVMRTGWDGQCVTTATGPSLPAGDQTGGRCPTWLQVSGDAGWGGVLADAMLSPSSKPTWVIFEIDQHNRLLQLINEAVALLPAQQRWQATFSTYAGPIPPDVDCKIRCVLSGSEEARFAPARGQVIRLQPTALAVPATPRIAAARGEAMAAPPPPSSAASGPAGLRPGPPAIGGPPALHASSSPPLAPPVVQADALPPMLQSTAGPPPRRTEMSKKTQLKTVLVASLALVFALLLVAAGLVLQRGRSQADAAAATLALEPQPPGKGREGVTSAVAEPARIEPARIAQIRHGEEQSERPPQADPVNEFDSSVGEGVSAGSGVEVLAADTEASSAARATEPIELSIVLNEDSRKLDDPSNVLIAKGTYENSGPKNSIRWKSSEEKILKDKQAITKGNHCEITAETREGQIQFIVTLYDTHAFQKELESLSSDADRFKEKCLAIKRLLDSQQAPLRTLSIKLYPTVADSSHQPCNSWLSGRLSKAATDEVLAQINAGLEEQKKEATDLADDKSQTRIDELNNLQKEITNLQTILTALENRVVKLTKTGIETDTNQELELFVPGKRRGDAIRSPSPDRCIKVVFLFRLEVA